MEFNLNTLLILAFLFFIGSLIGWVIEVIYRKFFSNCNPERKWINPGFLVGPYVPLYGFSLVILYVFSWIPVNFTENIIIQKLVLFLLMAVAITFIEFLAGLLSIKVMHIKLWDYSTEWGNIKGIICPKFTFYWMILSAIYYFFIHPEIIESLYWLSGHLTFSFFIGLFYGVFAVDFGYSIQLLVKIRKFARENQIELKIEEFKEYIIRKREKLKLRVSFMLPLRATGFDFSEDVKEFVQKRLEKEKESIENIKEKVKSIRK
ncbi:MAG: putative ABC transporter permease [Clostridia bacterium]|nr:putative ABC transporter permease [Clostridia bacterium]